MSSIVQGKFTVRIEWKLQLYFTSSPLSRDGETLELSDCCGLYEESAIAVGTSIHVLL